jgi:hypothetical protein
MCDTLCVGLSGRGKPRPYTVLWGYLPPWIWEVASKRLWK